MSISLVACASQPAGAPTDGEPEFSVTMQNTDDEIISRFKDNLTTIEIHSPSGIGSAAVRLDSGDLPERVVVQLHVRGLEEFRLTSARVTVGVSVSSGGGLDAQSQTNISGDSEQALRSSDALWLDIRIVSDSQSIPLEDGYFEIVIPLEFIQQSGGVFEIQWVDFFR